MRGLVLERPVCFLDIESTSADANTARIIELCVIKTFLNGDRTTKTWILNPVEPIDSKASEVHGYRNEDLLDKPTFNDVSEEVWKFVKDCDLAGYNSNKFDIPLLVYELARTAKYLDYTKINLIDVCNVFKINEPRTLAAAYEFYEGKQLQNAHSACADVTATEEIMESQLKRYPNVPREVKELAKYSNYGRELIDFGGKFARDEDGDLVFTFGKNKGKKAKEDVSYLQWIVSGDFAPDVKNIASKLIAGIKV